MEILTRNGRFEYPVKRMVRILCAGHIFTKIWDDIGKKVCILLTSTG